MTNKLLLLLLLLKKKQKSPLGHTKKLPTGSICIHLRSFVTSEKFSPTATYYPRNCYDQNHINA